MSLPSLSFIFRVLTKAGYTTKGSELTWLEHDGNWEILIDFVLGLNSTGNVAPYNSGTAYVTTTFPIYVSYNGNIYLYVGSGTNTGVTPGTNPAVWQLVSTGALAHVQNTDQYLDIGGPNQVSANELRILLNNQVILTNKATLDTLISTSALRGGYLYFVLDRGMFVRSIVSNKLCPEGYIIDTLADYQNVSGSISGQFNMAMVGSTTPVNQVWIWNNLHWKKITGAANVDSPDNDATNWVQLATSDASYQAEVFRIIYDHATDLITERWDDKRKNHVKAHYDDGGTIMKDAIKKFQWGSDSVWWNDVDNFYLECWNQRGTMILNKFLSEGEQDITANTIVVDDTNVGGINSSVFRSCYTDAGKVLSFDTTKGIANGNFYQTHVGNLDRTAIYQDSVCSPTYSNIKVTLDITGLATIDLDANNIMDYVGIVEMTTTNTTETITTISNASFFQRPVLFYFSATGFPIPTITFKQSAPNIFMKGASDFTLTQPADWIIFQDRTQTGQMFEINSGLY